MYWIPYSSIPIRFFCFFLWFVFIPWQVNAKCQLDVPVFPKIAAYEQAKDILQMKELLGKLETCPAKQDTLAYVYHRLGRLYFFNKDLDSAIYFTNKGLQIREQLSHIPIEDIGSSHRNLGIFYARKKQYSRSNHHFLVALEAYREAGAIEKEGKCARDISKNYIQLGELSSAENYAKIAIEIAERVDSNKDLVGAYIEYANIVGERIAYLGDTYEVNKEELNLIEEYLQQAIEICHKEGWKNDGGIAYFTLAKNYFYKKEYEKAVANYQIALKILPHANQLINNNLAVVYKHQGLYRKAQKLLEATKDVYDQNPHDEVYQFCLDNLADIHTLMGNYEQALTSYNEAIQLCLPHLTNAKTISVQDLTLVVNKKDLFRYFTGKARCLAKYAQENSQTLKTKKLLEQSLQTYELASQTMDVFKQELISDISYTYWQGASKLLSEEALNVCFLLDNAPKALFFMEKSKSNLLLKALWETDILALIGAEKINQKLLLVKELQEAQKELKQALQTGDDIPEKREELVNQQKALTDFWERLAIDYPQYYQYSYTVEVISIDKLRENLLDNFTSLIQYFWGKEALYILHVSNDDAHLEKIEINLELTHLIDQFLLPFHNHNERKNMMKNPRIYAQNAYHIFQEIYAPAWKTREELTPHVIIIPDGKLNFLPFDALLPEKSDVMSYSRFPYLLHQQYIRQALSATILALQKEKSTSNRGKLTGAAFAPFVNTIPRPNECQNTLRQLPHSANEFPLIPGKHFVNNDALLGNIKEYATEAELLHIATHGFASGCAQSRNNEPYMMFSDDNLYLSDLYSLHLDLVPIVVLRACETGKGEIQEGEGVLSFIRGFTYAGAQNVVASLWEADERASSNLILRFYEQLQSGQKLPEALTTAKRTYLAEADSELSTKKSPFYWAGFVSMGHDQYVKLPPRPNYLFYIGLLCGFMLLLVPFGWYRFKKIADRGYKNAA